MKIAAIGAGAWGRNLIRTLYQMDALAVVAEPAARFREQIAVDYPSVEVVSNYGDLAERTDISAVTIATPASTHYRIAKDCLLAGKDVFVEKPMTLTVAEAEDLVATAEKYKRILMVGHLLLYRPAIQFLRDYLRSGKAGKVFTLHQERMKLGRARTVENALWSLGVHDVAALLFLVGETPVKVTFSGHCGLQPGIEDDTFLHMTFASGQMAHLHNSWLWPEDRRGLRIICGHGMIEYDETAETISLVKKRIDDKHNNVDEGRELLFEGPRGFQALTVEMQHFMDCVRSRNVPLSCGRKGLDVIRVLEAAGKS